MKKLVSQPDHATAAIRIPRSTISKWLAIMAVGTLIPGVHAAGLFMEEGFDYSVGTLAGSGSWTNSASLIKVANGSLSYPGLAGTSPAGNRGSVSTGSTAVFTARPFDSAAESGSVYCSFLLNYSTTGGNYYFLGMLPSSANGPAGNTVDPCDLSFQTVSTSGGTYRLGIRGLNQGTTYATGVTLNINTDNLVIMKYDLDTGRASLFLNPSSLESEPAAADAFSNGSAAVADLDHFFIRMGGANAANYTIDNVRIGQTWSDVTPVPEPSAIALSLAGILVLVWRRMRY